MEQHSKSAGKKAPLAMVNAGDSPAASGDESKRTREGTDSLTSVKQELEDEKVQIQRLILP